MSEYAQYLPSLRLAVSSILTWLEENTTKMSPKKTEEEYGFLPQKNDAMIYDSSTKSVLMATHLDPEANSLIHPDAGKDALKLLKKEGYIKQHGGGAGFAVELLCAGEYPDDKVIEKWVENNKLYPDEKEEPEKVKTTDGNITISGSGGAGGNVSASVVYDFHTMPATSMDGYFYEYKDSYLKSSYAVEAPEDDVLEAAVPADVEEPDTEPFEAQEDVDLDLSTEDFLTLVQEAKDLHEYTKALNKELAEQKDKLDKENKELRNENKELNEKIESLQKEIKSYVKLVTAMEKNKKDLQDELTHSNASLEQSTKVITKLEKTLEAKDTLTWS